MQPDVALVVAELAKTRDRLVEALAAEGVKPLDPLAKYATFMVDGLKWTMLTELTASRENDRFDVTLRERDGARWTWERKLQAEVYVKVLGAAPTLRAAMAAVASYEPVIIKGEHLGQEVDWYETPRRWIASVGGDEATVIEMDRPCEHGQFLWTRRYNDGSPVVKLFAGQALQGMAETRDAAMIACLEAPERFRLAVAAMAARFYPRKAP